MLEISTSDTTILAMKSVLVFTVVLTTTLVAAQTAGSAPPGEPRTVAARAIVEAKHPCPALNSAKRLKDGSILAKCSNGEDYRIFTLIP